MNIHDGHKVLRIEDEETLKKENISIEYSSKEYNTKVEKLNNLKNLIEKEMTEIDNTYDKVDKEVTESYENKRDKINKEEENLKEKLKTEVTKIKEKFEISISEINTLLKTCDKIVKGIKSLEKEEKNMIKTLSYLSKINKNEKEIGKIFQQLMKNMKITYIENESIIKYEEYYFNGIPIPNNIEFNNIGTNSFQINWKIDNINLLNINNLDKNTNYEIRICSLYKDIISEYTKIYKIKTRIFKIDSNILNNVEKVDEYLKKLYEWTGYKKMELIYRGTRDGSDSQTFHNKCDNQGPTIILCKNEKDNIFGGYASISWTSDDNFHAANGSFLFTLTNIHGTAPTKYSNTQNYNYAVYHYSGCGPTFGGNHDLYICSNYLNSTSSYATLGYSYPDVLGKGNSIFSGDNNKTNFKLKELEVFKLLN